LIQELISEGVSGITRYEPPACEKIMRFHSQTAAFENGLVLLPKEAHWLADYVHEITTFPGSKHDDQVDSTTQALAWMRTLQPGMGFFEWMRQQVEAKAAKNIAQQPQNTMPIVTFAGPKPSCLR
jgi:hypothetical protein